MKHNDCNNCLYGGNKMRRKTRSKWHFLWVVLAFLIFFSIFLLIDYKDRVANAGREYQPINKARLMRQYKVGDPGRQGFVISKVCIDGYRYTVLSRFKGGGIVQDFKEHIFGRSDRPPQPIKCK